MKILVALQLQTKYNFIFIGLSVIGPVLQRVWTVARKEVFYYWPFGLTIWLSGVIIFIDRNNGKRSNIELMSYTEKIKEQKVSLS